MGSLDKTTAEVQQALDEQLDGDPASTVGWDDIAVSLIGRRLNSVIGTVDYNYTENSLTFSPSGGITDTNDTVVFNVQKPHRMQESGSFKFHVHWEQDFDGVMSPTFTYRYRIQANGELKTTSWTTVNVTSATDNEAFDRPTGTGEVVNQITKLGDIDLSSFVFYAGIDSKLSEFEQSLERIQKLDMEYAISGHKGLIIGKENIKERMSNYKGIIEEREKLILNHFSESQPVKIDELLNKNIIYKRNSSEGLEYEKIAEKVMIEKHIEKLVENKTLSPVGDGFILN